MKTNEKIGKRNFSDELETFENEAENFIIEKVNIILIGEDKFIKFNKEFEIEEGLVLGLAKQEKEMKVIILDKEVDEISFITMTFLSVDEISFIADMIQDSIELDSLDNI